MGCSHGQAPLRGVPCKAKKFERFFQRRKRAVASFSYHPSELETEVGIIDFTAHRHPVLAVSCPTCKARPGIWCQRPSEHRAHELHAERRGAADEIFIQQYGALASIERQGDRWMIDPTGRKALHPADDREPNQSDLFAGWPKGTTP